MANDKNKPFLGRDWTVLGVERADVGGGKGKVAKTAWLLSFVDLTSILVGFFVLVFATQTMKEEEWRDVTGSLRAAFAPSVAAAPAVLPSGSPNALAVVKPQRETLAYLDSLLRAQLAQDAVWKNLVGSVVETGVGREMVYPLESDLLDVVKPDMRQAWETLAGVVRSWKNPVMVRMVVTPQDENVLRAAAQVVSVVGILARMGVNVSGEVVVGSEESTVMQNGLGLYWVIGEGV